MKNNTKMIIHLELDKNFIEEIKKEMYEEIEIASKKWSVALNTEDEDTIIVNSIKQVRRKTSENVRTNWDLSDKITVKVNSIKKGIEITLPAPEAANSPTTLIYTRDGWELDQEKRDESVSLADFDQHMKNQIIKWARTAVFYGVASYSY